MKQDFDTSKLPEHPTARRKVLKKLLVGGGAAVAASQTLPTKWTKPVVDSVILPAHAQTTVVPTTPAPTTTVFMQNFRGPVSAAFTAIDPNQTQEGLFAVLDTIIPQAHAGTVTATGDMCIEVNGTNFTASLLIETVFYTGSGTVGGGAITLTDVNDCLTSFSSVSIAVDSASASGADYTLSGRFTSTGILPLGNGCPSDPGTCPAL